MKAASSPRFLCVCVVTALSVCVCACTHVCACTPRSGQVCKLLSMCVATEKEQHSSHTCSTAGAKTPLIWKKFIFSYGQADRRITQGKGQKNEIWGFG